MAVKCGLYLKGLQGWMAERIPKQQVSRIVFPEETHTFLQTLLWALGRKMLCQIASRDLMRPVSFLFLFSFCFLKNFFANIAGCPWCKKRESIKTIILSLRAFFLQYVLCILISAICKDGWFVNKIVVKCLIDKETGCVWKALNI